MNKMASDNATRLEDLWAGDFGNAYNQRNSNPSERRQDFWHALLKEFPVSNLLEIGCNVGGNLQWMHPALPWNRVYGIDINLDALATIHERHPALNAIHASAQNLPFRDAFFDLVFTAGVLIHQPEESLPKVMSEMVRCSKKYVLSMEYFAKETEEVPYHEQHGALFRRNYGKLFTDAFPTLSIIKEGFISP